MPYAIALGAPDLLRVTGRARIRLADRPSPVLKLQARKAGIKPTLSGKGFMSALFDDLPSIHHQNAVA